MLRDPKGAESFLSVAGDAGRRRRRTSATPLARTLLLAFLGGLLLNLMPCVFPVLAMKAMALARMSGQVRREAATHAAVVHGGRAARLRRTRRRVAGGAGGGRRGRMGVPVPVAGVRGGDGLAAVRGRAQPVRRVRGRRRGWPGPGRAWPRAAGTAGSFFTGLLAVLVATPCTAPFMGAAIAAALAAPASVTVLVFVAMGLGMALPYLLLALVPGLGALLPRPGKWMDVLRGVLAFPMYGAAVWLVWVLSLQAGPTGVLAALAGMVAARLRRLGVRPGAAGRALAARRPGGWRWPAWPAPALLLVEVGAAPAAAGRRQRGRRESFTPARLAALARRGPPGLRQHDRGLVRDLPGQRAHRAVAVSRCSAPSPRTGSRI